MAKTSLPSDHLLIPVDRNVGAFGIPKVAVGCAEPFVETVAERVESMPGLKRGKYLRIG
jgi:hypothetical protein